MRFCRAAVIVSAALFLTACADTAASDAEVQTETECDESMQNIAVSAAEEKYSEETSDETEVQSGLSSDCSTGSASADEILDFVDVFGKSYEVAVDQGIEKHTYDMSGFSREGQMLSYSDEIYSSRPGIDVSYHQGKIDWEKVAAQGFKFVILRIGYRGYGEEGRIRADTKFKEYYDGAKDAGLDVGAYFFAQAVNVGEAEEEADFVIKELGGAELDLPVVYDPESILDHEARTDNVSGEQFTKNTAAFCRKITDAGYEPMVYSNMLWEAYELDLKAFPDVPVWYADYEKLPQTPYRFSYWQYSNKGEVDGISGRCDLDIQFLRKQE